MSDLISRQAAIDALNGMKIYRPLDSDRWIISDCINKIVDLPSTQPERKTGRWIEDSGNIACSICHTIWLHRHTSYCPNCGAKMEVEHD